MENLGKIIWFILIQIIISLYGNKIVETSIGKIIGLKHSNYYSFESIPYAEPPIGDLRFESPKPYNRFWDNEVYNATMEPPECIQWDHWVFEQNKLHGKEDCLYLNIYTPNIEGNDLYPVIVFIHGGAFMFGSGSFLKQNLLMNEGNIVFVSFNYRLGPMGFLSTQDKEISGNMGLKDQQLALQWIKTNIDMFKGNPDQISLTGFSAGGTSVHLQLLSEKTKSLQLKSAVSHSGTATVPWALIKNPLENTMKLAKLIDCPTDSSKLLKTCLKNKPVEEIVSNVNGLQTFLFYPFTVFGPVVEPNYVEDAFITETPEILIKKNKTANVPWLISYVKNEGGYPAAELIRVKDIVDNQLNLDIFLENFDEFAPIELFYDKSNQEQLNSNLEYLKKKYNVGAGENTFQKYANIQNMFTKELFINGILDTIKYHRNHSESKVFVYIYDNPAEYGLAQILANRTDYNFGTVHGDDVFLIYNLPVRDTFKFRPDEEIISKKFIDMMRNFAITGKLTYGNLEVPHNIPKSNKISYLKITREKASIVSADDDLF